MRSHWQKKLMILFNCGSFKSPYMTNHKEEHKTGIRDKNEEHEGCWENTDQTEKRFNKL